MKILFLDIDGVLNSDEYARRYHKYNLKEQGYHIWVDPSAVEKVTSLCDLTGAKVILSSSWRSYNLQATIESLKEYRDLIPLIPYIIGVTPGFMSRHRGREIKDCLDRWASHVNMGLIDGKYANEKIEKYAIVDDDSDMLQEQQRYFVQTDWWTGITNKDVIRLKEMLS